MANSGPPLRCCCSFRRSGPGAPCRSLIIAVAIGCTFPAHALELASAPINARLKTLGLEQRDLADQDNPILALQKPLKEFEEKTKGQFQTSLFQLHRLPRFTDHEAGDETLAHCRHVQTRVLEIMSHGPGQIPVDLYIEKFNIFPLLAFQKANRALAARARTDQKLNEAISHLAHTLTAADFILASDPNLVSYLVAVNAFRRGTCDDLIELYRRHPDPKLLDRIVTLHRQNSFRPIELAAAWRGETRYNLQAYSQEPAKYFRELDKQLPKFWRFLSREPLASCTLEQLLALRFQHEQSQHLILDALEGNLRWIEAALPLSAHPNFKTPRGKPKALAYFQKAPNGLFEIFADCAEEQAARGGLIVNRSLDVLITTTLAWLRAEADGVKVVSLSTLVPKYLPKIPADPADGKPLRCLAKKRRLYAIGGDLKDDGGRSNFDEGNDEEDPTFDLTIEVPTVPSLVR